MARPAEQTHEKVLLVIFYLWAAVLASKIPAPCIQERTGVMPVGSGSSFMVRAPRGRLSWMENIKVSWELCLHQKQERRRIILPVSATQKSPRTTWIKVESRGAMRRKEEAGGEEGHTSELPPKYRVLIQRRAPVPSGLLRGCFRSQPRFAARNRCVCEVKRGRREERRAGRASQRSRRRISRDPESLTPGERSAESRGSEGGEQRIVEK